MERRAFMGQAAQAAALAASGGLLWHAFLVRSAHAAPFSLRPPGAQPEAAFAGACIRCGACVQACPYGVLKLATLGDAALPGTPYFTAREAPCRMCPEVPCARACPTGALDRGIADVATARMGLAVIDPEACLSWQGLRCEVCSRACPVGPKAISVQPHPRVTSRHAVFVPVVHADACTGCGLCEQRCPTEVAAIRIQDPARVRGRLGAHYRLQVQAGGAADAEPVQATGPARRDAPPPAGAPARVARPPAATPGAAPGVDYLNEAPR